MEIFLIGFIAVVTFFTRVVNLLNIPIFTDEAIYIRWAQIGLNDPVHRYISLTDGKQPLLTWLMYPFLLIFQDPLFAGRFVSVIAGVGSAVGMYFLAKELFDRRAAFFAVAIYIFSPFTFVYDRLALMDSLLTLFGVWSLYLSVLLIRKRRLDAALLLGISIGLGVLTKSSAFFYLYLLPLNLLLFNFKDKKKIVHLLKWAGLAFITFVIAQVMYNSLRLSPWFYIIEQKNYTFIYTFGEFIKKPFEVFKPNLNGLSQILITYLTLPISLTVFLGIVRGFVKRDKTVVYLLLWFLIPFLFLTTFGKVIYPRFILFMVMPLFVIAADMMTVIVDKFYKNKRILVTILSVIFAYPILQSFLLLVVPVEAAIHRIDKIQLFDDWPSGYGVKEVIEFFKEKAKQEKIVIGTEGTFGLNPAVYEIYLGNNKNVEIYGFWPVVHVPEKLLEKAKEHPTYLVLKERQDVPSNWPLKLLSSYRRGKGNTYLYLYQVTLQ